MLYVEDAVAAYDAFHCSELRHGVFNLGGGKENTLSLIECTNMLEEMTGKKLDISYADWRTSDQKCYISDIRKAKTLLNWKPAVDPREGLERCYAWVAANLDVF